MAKTTDLSHIAGYLFVVGLIAAVVAGLAVGLGSLGADVQSWISVAFVAIGVAIGAFMSTSKKIEEEIYVIVLVSLGLLVVSNMAPGVFTSFNTAIGANIGTALNLVITYVALFSALAIIVLAIRTLTHFHMKKIG